MWAAHGKCEPSSYYTFDIQTTKMLMEQICFEQVMMLNILTETCSTSKNINNKKTDN